MLCYRLSYKPALLTVNLALPRGQVACLSSQELEVNVLWIINQMVNLVFVADMVISFHTIYRESAKNGSGLVKDLDLVRMGRPF